MNDNIQRITTVIRVLNKHGLGSILSKYGFSYYLPFFSRGNGLPSDTPQKIRMAMEELGGAYIKLGQLLSIRPDLIPQEYCDEFTKLLDEVQPEPLSVVISTIEQEFKRPIKDLFTHIDSKPLGSASVAQVHKARMKNGAAAAVKVQRPDIRKKFTADIDIIRYIAQKIQKHLQNNVNVIQIVDEFERYTKKELDFTVEAGHIDEIRKETKSREIVIPKVFWTHTAEKVLTMEYLDGTKLSELKKVDKPRTAKMLIDAFVEEIFQGGTFHADLHPGNVLLMKNNKLGLLDFGIVGHLDQRTKKLGLDLYLAVLERNPQHIAQVLLKYGIPTAETKTDEFMKEVSQLVSKWWESNPEQRKVSHLMHQLFVLCAKHKIIMPVDTILLGKAMMTVEATAHQIDQHFNFVKYSEPKIAEMLKKQKSPRKLVEEFVQRSKTFAEALSELPSRTLDAVDRIKETGISVNLKDVQFRHLGKDINLSSNRLSYAMISAALILAASLMVDIGPKIASYSVISLVSLIVATLFVILLFISITREGLPRFDNHES